jgi:hypothetical protein
VEARYYSTTGCSEWGWRIEFRGFDADAGAYRDWDVLSEGEVPESPLEGPPLGSIRGMSVSPMLTWKANLAQYRTVFENAVGTTITSAPATVTIREGCDYLPMDEVPSSMKYPGETAVFDVHLNEECDPTNSAVSWEQTNDGGQNWQTIPWAAGTSYSKVVAAADHGTQYRSVLELAGEEVRRGPAVLTVASLGAPVVTRRVTHRPYIRVGESALLRADAMGQEEPTVQWQKAVGNGYEDIPGATSRAYLVTATKSGDLGSYRAVFTNSLGTATAQGGTIRGYVGPTPIPAPSAK